MTTDVQTVLAGLRARPSSIDHLVWLLAGEDPEVCAHAIEAAGRINVGRTNLGDLLSWMLGGYAPLVELGFEPEHARRFVAGLAWGFAWMARADVVDVRVHTELDGVGPWGLVREEVAFDEPNPYNRFRHRPWVVRKSCQYEMGDTYYDHPFEREKEVWCVLFKDRPVLHWTPTWELHGFEDFGELRAAVARGDLSGVRLDPGRHNEWLTYLKHLDLNLLATGITWKRRNEVLEPLKVMGTNVNVSLELCGLILVDKPSWLKRGHKVSPEFRFISPRCLRAFAVWALARHFDREQDHRRQLYDLALLGELEDALERPHAEDDDMPNRWSEWGGFAGGERDWRHAASALVLIRDEVCSRHGAARLSQAWFARADDTDIYLREEGWLVTNALRVMEIRFGEDFGVSSRAR